VAQEPSFLVQIAAEGNALDKGLEVRRVTLAANLDPHKVHIGRILVKVDGIAHFAEVAPQLVFFSPNDREFEDGERSGSKNQQNRRRDDQLKKSKA
jgi:hypothetical protein